MNSQNVARPSKNAILISDFRRRFKSSCRIYLSIFIKHDYFYISINTYFMALSISILCLGFWILSKDNALLSTKVRLLFYLSLAGLVISSSIQTESVAGIFLALAISCTTLAAVGFVLDMLNNNKFSQIMILVLAVFGSYYISESTYNKQDLSQQNLIPDTKGEILLEIDRNHFSSIQEYTNKENAVLTRAFRPFSEDLTNLDDYYTLDVQNSINPESMLSDIGSLEGVKWIEYNEIIPFELPKSAEVYKSEDRGLSNDPSVVMQWHLSFLEMEKYYPLFSKNQITPKKTAKLYILDTGIDSGHEDLQIRRNSQKDKQGHGTHCAGVASAITNNSIGVASMSPGKDWIDVHGIQVIGDVGFGSQKTIIEGIIQAADEGADVISMSLGGITNQEREKVYNDAVKYANDKGAIVVVAAGNANLDGKRYSPANAENVITVTSINEKGEKSGFSNHVQNLKMGISAPGERILSTTPSNTYTSFNGTSMATPQVAGLVAVIKAIRPELDTKSIYSILSRTGKETQNTIRTGKLIQPYKAIQLTLSE